MESLRLELGERAYPIHIGSGVLDSAELYRPHVAGRAIAIVTNDVVAPHYLDRVKRALAAAGAEAIVDIVVEDGERAKRWENIDRVCGALLQARFGRDSLVVALGGGVVGDLAGFAAAVYQRGVPFIQVPTTLLAQVDSSVGGKTGINHARGKNMIGAFHQPRAVIADVAVLGTLPERELRAGLAEVIKHGLALDAQFTEWLEASMANLLGRDAGALGYAVKRSCELKARVVAADEREAGMRALLNFGHTFGHAIENGAGYGRWLHGEAIGAGMVMAAELSFSLGFIEKEALSRARALIGRAGLPHAPPDGLSPEELLRLMAVDKKAAAGKLRFVLLRSIGRSELRGDVSDEAVLDAIRAAQR